MHFRKIIDAFLLSAVCVFVAAPAPAVYATESDTQTEESTNEEESEDIDGTEASDTSAKTSVQVLVGFRFSDNSIEIWETGGGVVMDASNILVPSDLVITSSSDDTYQRMVNEKQETYRRIGVDLGNYDDIKKSIVTFVCDEEGNITEAEIARTDEATHITLLTADVSDFVGTSNELTTGWSDDMLLCGYTSDQLNENVYRLQNDVMPSSTYQTLTVIDSQANEQEDSSVFTMVSNVDLGMLGAGIYDRDFHLCGMVTGVSQNQIRVIDSASMQSFLNGESVSQETQGTETDTESTNESMTVADAKDTLMKRIEQAKALDTISFTEEAVSTLNNAIAAAEVVLENENATVSEVTDADNSLKKAMNATTAAEPIEEDAAAAEAGTEINMSKLYMLGGIIIAIVVAIIVVLLFLKKKVWGNAPTKTESSLLKREKKEKKEKVEKKSKVSEKKATKPLFGKKKEKANDGAYGGTYARQSTKNNLYANEENGGEEDTTLLNTGMEETTLLNPSAMLNAFLTTADGENIKISKSEFTMGKERKKVTYCVYNPTVSRLHCIIKFKNGTYTLEDLGSLNGTMLNGVELMANTPVELNDGDVIVLSDSTFTFHNEDV